MHLQTVYLSSLGFLGLDSDLSLYVLIILSIFWIFTIRKISPYWSWHVYVKATLMGGSAILGLTVGPHWIYAYIGWLFFLIFYMWPILLFKAMNKALLENNDRKLLNIARWQRLINWGEQGRYLYDTNNALSLYLRGDKKSADKIVDYWLNQPIPINIKNQIADNRLQGLLWAKEWQQIIDEYERQRNRGLVVSGPMHILASRAYCEQSNFKEAAQCINAFPDPKSRNDVYYLGMSLLFFYCLRGATENAQRLLDYMSRYKYPLPDYIKYFWLGRLFQQKSDTQQADDSFATALKAAQNLPNWQKRINEAKDQITSQNPADIENPNSVEQSWQKLTRAMSVQELIAPRYGFKTVDVLMKSIVIVFFLSHSYSYLPNSITYLIETTCYDKGILVPARVLAGEYWRLFTFLFLHAHLVHALLNIIALLWLGKMTEKIYGAVSFLLIYFLSGILSGIVSIIFCPSMLAIGASGAIMGIFGSTAVGIFRLKDFLPASIRKRYLNMMIGLLIFQIIIDHIIPQIDSAAHLGGLVSGILLGVLIPISSSLGKSGDKLAKLAL